MATSSSLGFEDCAAQRSGTITCDTPARRAARSATPSQPGPAPQVPVSPHPQAENSRASPLRPSATRQRPRGRRWDRHHSTLTQYVPQHERTEECGEQHRGVEQGKPARTQLPVLRDEGGGDPDDEQVVGVGEEPQPGHQHRPQMETAQRRLIQRCEQVLNRISVTASPARLCRMPRGRPCSLCAAEINQPEVTRCRPRNERLVNA
jgi:hypothetical protein